MHWQSTDKSYPLYKGNDMSTIYNTTVTQNEYTMLIVLSMDRPNEDKKSICYPKGSYVASQLCIVDHGNMINT